MVGKAMTSETLRELVEGALEGEDIVSLVIPSLPPCGEWVRRWPRALASTLSHSTLRKLELRGSRVLRPARPLPPPCARPPAAGAAGV